MNNSSAVILLGYNLHYNKPDVFGNNHRYRVSPMREGSILFFDSKEQLEKWIEEVNEIRSMQFDGVTLLDFMRNNANSNR